MNYVSSYVMIRAEWLSRINQYRPACSNHSLYLFLPVNYLLKILTINNTQNTYHDCLYPVLYISQSVNNPENVN